MYKTIWAFIFNILKMFWKKITSKRDYIYIFIISIFSLLMIHQCNNNESLNKEVNRLENNIYAITDTLTQYQDENGKIIAEKHAFQLTEKELRDSVNLLKIKNREYITYINTHIGIKDTVEIPTYISRTDTIYYADKGFIKFDKYDIFGKSSRELHVSIPYYYDDKLYTDNANVSMKHDIFVESMIERNTKTGETFVRLMSDYPNLTFNSGMGVFVSNSKSYEKEIRKTKGIGFSVGPNVGLSYDMVNQKIVPTIGFGVTIGFNYTPKWTQW